jgi:hypothetical protein
LNVAGQEVNRDTVLIHENKHSLKNQLRYLQDFLDSAAKKKVDAHYIEVPEKPWRVILRSKQNAVDVDYSQGLDFPDLKEHSEWNLCFQPRSSASVGFWVGYRGTGISFSKSLSKNSGRYFSVTSTGARYGFNFRLRRFSTSEAKFTASDYYDGQLVGEPIDTSGLVQSPVWIRSVYVNGYYVLNGRRYSQAAAYNQSVIQRRSAGSFLIGATWYQSSFDYSDIKNGFFMLIGHGIHRIKVHQANIGFGYGYNLVPFKGFVVNVMAMPTVSVYNRVKVYKYDFNYDLSPKEAIDDYGHWNKETRTWENGKTHKSVFMIGETNESIDYWEVAPETVHSVLRINADLRVGVAYNWKNYFIGLQAQYNNFTYNKDQCKVNIFDAYARVSLGVRL